MGDIKRRKKMGRQFEDQLTGQGPGITNQEINDTLRAGYDELGREVGNYDDNILGIMTDFGNFVGSPKDAGKYLGKVGKARHP